MGINIVRILPEDVWRNFLAGNPAANIFHTPDMFRVFERAAETANWATPEEIASAIVYLCSGRSRGRERGAHPAVRRILTGLRTFEQHWAHVLTDSVGSARLGFHMTRCGSVHMIYWA